MLTKRSLWLAALLAAMILQSAHLAAQEKPPAPPPKEQAAPEPRIDIDFPGGTMGEFMMYLEKVQGAPPSVILSKEAEEVPLPALRLHKVTVAEAMTAIGRLRQIGSYEIVVHESQGGILTVVAAQSGNLRPTTEVSDLIKILDTDLEIDDVVTAITTAWSLQLLYAGPKPELRYHSETGLLIVVGSQWDREVVRSILQTLSEAEKRVRLPEIQHYQSRLQGVDSEIHSLKYKNQQLEAAIDELKAKFEDLLHTRESK